jgi:hypothetical protein
MCAVSAACRRFVGKASHLPEAVRQAPLSALLPETLTPRNRLVFAYWQSLRRGKALPLRADFALRPIVPVLGRLMLFDVRPGEALACRLMGTELARLGGSDITGRPFEAFTPPEGRSKRLGCFSRAVKGEVMFALRDVPLDSGRQAVAQELILPFGDVGEDGARQALVISDVSGVQAGERADARVFGQTHDDVFFVT